jgi:AAHS family 3-hydroxyphenylpropionic acid transporter
VGFALAIGRIGSATGPLLAGAMLGSGLGPTQVLEVMAPLMALAGVCAWWVGRRSQPAPRFADVDAVVLPAQ